MSVIISLILEEEKRLKGLLPIYVGKMIGSTNDKQSERYRSMHHLAEKDLEELTPFADLAREKQGI